MRQRARRLPGRCLWWRRGGGRVVLAALLAAGLPVGPASSGPEGQAGRQGPGFVCGSCPSGYATTGVTADPNICRGDDPTLVHCVPLGANLLAVCGACPEGYREVGSSLVPARCGGLDGGRLSQCQLPALEGGLPDPTQGGVRCPPDCAGTLPTPGQGAMEPGRKYRPAPSQPER